MNGDGTLSLFSPPSCSFYGIGLSSQGRRKGRKRWREEVQRAGGAPASFLRIRVGGFDGKMGASELHPLQTPPTSSSPSLTTINPTHPRDGSSPSPRRESTALKVM